MNFCFIDIKKLQENKETLGVIQSTFGGSKS